VAFKDNSLGMHSPDVMVAERLMKSVGELLRGGVLAALGNGGRRQWPHAQ
jgi:hypothetical protein